jgi:transcription elongation factor Elf1
MKVSFACPSCNAAGSVDAVHIGKQVRCKQCGAHFAIPDPEASQPDIYDLEEPSPQATRGTSNSPAEDAVFVPARGDAGSEIDRPRRKERTVSGPTSRSARARKSEFPWLTWLIRGGVALVLILTAIALLAPDGTWLVGCILISIGGILVPVAYFAGAYGAFSEDVLYGFLYITIPLYTAYYLVTRWEDLWVWATCATVGVGLVLIGTEMVRWAGAPV